MELKQGLGGAQEARAPNVTGKEGGVGREYRFLLLLLWPLAGTDRSHTRGLDWPPWVATIIGH